MPTSTIVTFPRRRSDRRRGLAIYCSRSRPRETSCVRELHRAAAPLPGDLSDKPEHDDGAEERNDDRPDIYAGDAGVSKQAEDPSSHDGADDTNHQVA